MRTNEYYQCPYCQKHYKGVIPKGGEETGVSLPLHHLWIPLDVNIHKKVRCPGSIYLIESGGEKDKKGGE